MRVGIDARELVGRPTGVGRYLAALLGEWGASREAQGHEFVLYVDAPLGTALDPRRFPTSVVPGPRGAWWEQVSLPRRASRDHLDAFFAPGYTAPLALRVPLVVTIHDLSFVAHPEWFRVREGIRRRWLTREAARRARAIITVSRFSAQEINSRLDVPSARIHIIRHGVTAPATMQADRPIPSVLFVGSIFNRRRVPDLIRAFAVIARAHPDAVLDIVGDNRTYPRQDLPRAIAAEALEGRVRLRDYVSDTDLSALYGRARAFVFLSEYEGFGLTPLEALASGVPPLVGDTEVAHESYGEAALYVPVGDVARAAAALERLLFDSGARRDLLSAAPATLARYDWAAAARETLEVIAASARGARRAAADRLTP